MEERKTQRGFKVVYHESYPNESEERLVQESSIVEQHLWIGDNFHLNKDEVRELKNYLNYWLETEKLF